MPIPLQCPACDAKLNAPDAAAGKRVKCPKCAKPVPVPAAEEEGFEVIDDVPTKPKAKSAEVRKARPRDDDEEDDRPRRKKPRADEDEGDEDAPRSRRRRDEDEDEEDDDRPRKRKAAGKKKGLPLPLLIGGGVAAVLVLGAILFFTLGGGPSAPPGYTAVNDSEGGYRVFLPGTVVKSKVTIPDEARDKGFEMSAYAGSDGPLQVRGESRRLPGGAVPGNSPEQLFGHLHGVQAKWNTIVSQETITLDGKPALLVKVRENKNWMDEGRKEPEGMPPPPGMPADMRRQWEEDQAEFKKTRDKIRADNAKQRAGESVRHDVHLVTTTADRVIVIHLEGKDAFPSDEMIKTVRESFRFR